MVEIKPSKPLLLFLSLVMLSGFALAVSADVTVQDSDGVQRPVDTLCVNGDSISEECKTGQSSYSFDLDSEGNYDFSVEDDRYRDTENSVYIWQDGQKVTISVQEDSQQEDNHEETDSSVENVNVEVEDVSGIRRPVDQVTVEQTDGSWEKTRNGVSSFSFDAPASGNYEFSISDDRYSFDSKEINIWEDGQQANLEVQEKEDDESNGGNDGGDGDQNEDRDYTIDVSVKDDSGIYRPVDELSLETEGGSVTDTVYGRSQAEFTVDSKGNYELEVEDDRWDERTGSVNIWEDNQPVTLRVERKNRGDRPHIDLRQPYDGENGVSRNPVYRFKITDEDDSEMEDTTLYLEEKDFSGDEPWNAPDYKYNIHADVGDVDSYSSTTTWLDPDQDYIWGIKADDGDQVVRSEVYSFTTQGRDDNDDNEDGSLEVTVRDGDYDRLENAHVRVKNGDYRTDRTNYRGESDFNSLHPDWYDVRVRCDGETETDTVHVSEDEDEKLTVRMDQDSSDDYCDDEDDDDDDGDEGDRPEASFSISDTNPEIGESVKFDASGSDGDIMEYRWAFPDGTTKYGTSVYKSFDSAGEKSIQLRVTEYDYDQDRTSRTITVRRREDDDDDEDESDDPTARLDIDPSDAEIGEEIEFDATDSYDDGEIEEYEFDLDGDGDWDVENDDGEVERTFFEEFDGEARVRVTDDDGNRDIADEDYEVRSRSRVSISTIDIPERVCDSESFEATFEVENLGDSERFVVLEARGFGDTRSRTIELDEDETREVSMTLTAGDAGSRTVRVSAQNSNTVRNTVDVLECDDGSEGDVSGISVSVMPDRVKAGESVQVSGYVENTRGRENVRILMNGRLVADTQTQPDGYYQVYAYPEEIGGNSIVASSGGQTARTRIEVLPTVSVSTVETPENIFQGETFEICGRVESQISPLVVLMRNGERIDSKYGEGEVCFDTVSNTAGETEYSIQAFARGESGSQSREVEILETKPETSSFPGQIASVESGDGIVKATLYNNHDEQRRYDLELSGLPSTWVSTSEKQVILQPGEEREVFFYLTPREEGERTADVRIESQGSTIYDESVEVWTGGTTENQSRSITWRLRNAFSWW